MKFKLREADEGVSISAIASILIGFIYISGYLISTIYIRSRGIAPLPLLKAQYIETGLVFFILTSLIIVIPIVVFNLAVRGRQKHGKKPTGTVLIPVFLTTNYLIICLFLAVFVTQFEWESHSHYFFYFNITVEKAMKFYLITTMVLLIFLPILRHADINKKWYWFIPSLSSDIDNSFKYNSIKTLVYIIWVISIVITIGTDIFLFLAIPWLKGFIYMGLYYFLTTIILLIFINATKYLSNIFKSQNRKIGIGVVILPFIITAFYFCLVSYSKGVYSNIPISRGGKYPTYKAIFSSDSLSKGFPNCAYIVEQTSNEVYMIPVSVKNWFNSDENIKVYSLSKIKPYTLIHLSNGEPRMNHLRDTIKSDP